MTPSDALIPIAELVRDPCRLRSFLAEVLESQHGKCLDNDEDRSAVVEALARALEE